MQLWPLAKNQTISLAFVQSSISQSPISKLNAIPDLAACRIIFYSTEDLNKAVELLLKEFGKQALKDKMFGQGYKGVHFIGSLGKKRKLLSEYSQIADLTFEIQATTIFAHGWNEWEHDIFYKDKRGVKKAYPDQFQALKKIADGISERLKEAQDAWEDIKEQYANAAEGKGIFSPEIFASLSQSSSNNEIYDFFNNLNSIVQKVGALPATLRIEDISESVVKVFEKAKSNKVIPEKTIFGTLPGKTLDDIVPVMLKLLRHISHRGLDKVTDLLLEIYPFQKKNTQLQIEEWFKEIAKYRFHTLKEQGYIVQGYFVSLFSGWDLDKRKRFIRILCAVGSSVFSPDFEGTSSTDYKTLTFHRGGLGGDKNIRKIRDALIDLLIDSYEKLEGTNDKLNILKSLNNALRPSSYYDGGITDVIKENTKKIVSFYNRILPTASWREIAEMEESVGWAEKRFEKESFQEIESFWKLLESDSEYDIHRSLVGYERTFRLKEKVSYDEAEKLRDEKLETVLKSIDRHSESAWKARILKIAKEPLEGADIGEYQYLRKLLRRIGREKETLAWALLASSPLKLFREDIIAGLLLNKKPAVKQKVLEYVLSCISKRKYLYEIAVAYWIADILDKKIYQRILDEISTRPKKERATVLFQLLKVFHFERKNKKLILETIEKLNEIENYEWAHLYYQPSDKKTEGFFRLLNKKEWGLIMEVLVNTRSIDYHEEYILEHLIETDPKCFVEVFERRLKKEKRTKDGLRFEAIPFRLHYLTEDKTDALKNSSKDILNEVLRWYENQDYGWQAGLFLKTLFPHSDRHLEEKINEVIDLRNKEAWIKYVYPYIRWHQEDASIESYVQRTIIKLPKDKEIWDACLTYLLNPGSLSGNIDDPIFADAYRKKKEMILKWPSGSKKLRDFKDKYVKYLDRAIQREEYEHKKTLGSMKRRHTMKLDS